jgi:hypothetical protein
MTRNKVLQTFGWVGGYIIVILSEAYAEPKDPTNGVLTLPMGSFGYAQDDKRDEILRLRSE